MDAVVTDLTKHSNLQEREREAIRALPTFPMQVQREQEARSPDLVVPDACLVVSGLVGSVAFTKEGKRQIIAIFIPGEVCNIGSVIAEQSVSTLMALTSSDVRWIKGAEIERLTQRNLAITKALWRHSVLQSAVLKEWVVNLGRRFARERVAHLFCEMACRYAPHAKKAGLEFTFPVTQEQIADIVGLTPVRVNQTLRSLRVANAVDFRRGKVKILDWDKLAQKGDFSPYYLPYSD